MLPLMAPQQAIPQPMATPPSPARMVDVQYGEEIKKQAMQRALLQAGLALMALQQPSRMPISPVSQVGQAGLQGLQGYESTLENAAKIRQGSAPGWTIQTGEDGQYYRVNQITGEVHPTGLKAKTSEAGSTITADKALSDFNTHVGNVVGLQKAVAAYQAKYDPFTGASVDPKIAEASIAKLQKQIEGEMNYLRKYHPQRAKQRFPETPTPGLTTEKPPMTW